MRVKTENRLQPGRIGALLAIAMMAALIAIGYRATPASATGCSFTLANNGVGIADHTAAEGEGPGGGFHIIVVKLGPANCSGGVNLTLASGSATVGTPSDDVTNIGIFGLTFQPSEQTRELNIFPNDDLVASEGSETFTVNMAAHAGDTAVAPVSQTLTIIDNDGPPVFSFSASNYDVTEGTASVTVTVNRSGATGIAVNVTYATSNGGAAQPGDYTAIAPTVLNFGALEISKTFNVTIVNDSDVESNETINLILSLPSNGGSVGPNSTVTIIDNDGPGTVQFKQTGYTGIEGTTASFEVSRTGGGTGAVSATCGTIQNGTATAGIDYTAVPVQSLLSWVNGDTADKLCQVAILPDGDFGTGETFGLTLTSANLGSPSSATVTISDTSGTGSLQFTQSSYTGPENGGAITITVSRTGGSTGIVTVDLATTTVGSTAASGIDYSPTSTTLTFVGGDTSESWTVSPIDDVLVEGTEYVNVVLTNVTGGATIGSPSTAQVNITDNESPLPSITNLNPASGAIIGGTLVTISGINFTGATLVTFDGIACTSLIVSNSTTLSCVTPAHVGGVVQVVVTTPAGSSSTVGVANDFTYTGGPTIVALNPATGLATGNTIVTITGTNFTSSGTVVKFDGIVAVFSFIDSTTLVAVSPAHSAGTIDVSVTTPGGISPNTAADDFTYTGASNPVVTSLSPTSGPIGTTVLIFGSGLSGATNVSFGGVSATYTVNNDGQITASVPSGTPIGSVDVRVTTPSGTSSNTAADNFTNTSSGATVTYTLFFRFTLIVWTGQNNVSALAALKGLETPDNPNTNNVLALIGAIWRFDAATQTFKGYFPGSDGVPGANDFTTLSSGVGYFVALLNPGTVTWTTLGAN